jgi:hypothetical protein
MRLENHGPDGQVEAGEAQFDVLVFDDATGQPYDPLTLTLSIHRPGLDQAFRIGDLTRLDRGAFRLMWPIPATAADYDYDWRASRPLTIVSGSFTVSDAHAVKLAARAERAGIGAPATGGRLRLMPDRLQPIERTAVQDAYGEHFTWAACR